MILVSSESGKSDTKFKIGEVVGKFQTKITENEEVIKGVDKNSYNIVYNGKLYKVGDTADRNSLEVSKDSDIHRICILASICKALPEYEQDVKLVTGTPANLFFTDERDKIKEKLTGKFELIFDGKRRTINIQKVLVVPETMGYIYSNFKEFKNQIVAVLDIGGLNTNGCIYKNGLPLRETVFTLNNGINILITKVKNELNKGGYNFQDYEILHLMAGCGGYEEEVITGVIDKYLEDIIQSMRANGWNYDKSTIHFTGGGSMLLSNYIKNKIKYPVISEDCTYDNAKGFYKVGESLL